MSEHLHPGPHPDAELLNAFMEGVLPQHERQECLSHLAECLRCREIVFLAQPPAPAAAPSVVVTPLWRRWFAPLPAFSAALAACALIVAVSLYRHQTPQVLPRQPQVAALTRKSAQPALTEPPQESLEERKPAASAARLQARANSAPPAAPLIPAQEAARESDAASAPPAATGAIPSGAGGSAETASARASRITPPLPSSAPPSPPSQPPAAQRQELAMSGRDASLAQLTTQGSASPSSVTKREGAFVMSRSRDSIRPGIEHDREPAKGLSEVRGSVKDATGAVISGATVTLHQIAGDASGATVTNADGQFAVAALPAGRYELEVESPGFQKASTQVELQPQDLALVASTLSVGSAAETVEVTSASPSLPAAAAKPTLSRKAGLLSGTPPAGTVVENGKRMLRLDSAGALFLSRDEGRHWKTVKPQWWGKVASVVVAAEPPSHAALQSESGRLTTPAPVPSAQPAAGPLVFQLTTDSGSVWLSQDGTHWRLAPPHN
jgi:hypothetical protein